MEAGKIATTPLTKKNKNKTGKEKYDAIDTEEESGHVWDEHLSQMEISKKRQSVVGGRKCYNFHYSLDVLLF